LSFIVVLVVVVVVVAKFCFCKINCDGGPSSSMRGCVTVGFSMILAV